MSGLVSAHTNGLYRGPGMEAHVYRWFAGIINHEGVNSKYSVQGLGGWPLVDTTLYARHPAGFLE